MDEYFTEASGTTLPSSAEAHLDDAAYYRDAAYYVRLYATPMLLFGGVAGNVACCVVLQSKHFRHTRTALLLTTLAVVDTLVLLSNLLDFWLASLLYGTTPLSFLRNQGSGGCKSGVFLTYFLSHLASWILVLVNLDRVVTVTAPLRAKNLFQPRYHAIALAIIATVLCFFDLHTLFLVEPYTDSAYQNETGYQICSIVEEHMVGKYPDFLIWSDFVLLSFLPFVIIVVCNSIILIYMYRAQRGSSFRRATSSVTVMLVVVSITFLVTTTPLVLYYILFETIVDRHKNDEVSLTVSTVLVGDTVLVLLCYTNNAVNFVLYYLCGSRFRYALQQMIREKWRRRRDSSRSSERSHVNNITTV